MSGFLDRWQIVGYVLAILAGVLVATTVPAAGAAMGPLVTPVLALLIFATFLGVPFERMTTALRDGRFLGALMAVNLIGAPLVAFAVTRLIPAEGGALLGALIVLLCPCVDYVVVFAGLAGGARERLLAATPLLMAVQLVTLPLFLWLMLGADAVATIDLVPFVEAFAVVIVLPLALAVVVRALGRRRVADGIRRAGDAGMIPLMMLTLALVVAAHLPAILARPADLLTLLGVAAAFAVFAAVMGLLGEATARGIRLAAADRRAIVFSGVTRNSLVVLPLALGVAASAPLAPLVVVTQTLVELVVMVLLVAVYRPRRASDT